MSLSIAALIANPAARKTSLKKIEEATRIIEKRGLTVKTYLTEKKGDGIPLAKKAIEEGASLVIAAGGDGTFNEVMNGLLGANIPMALLPMGTTNVLAKELNIPEDTEGSIKTVLSGKEHIISTGRLAFEGVERDFFLMAGIGFDAEAVYSVDKRLKRYSGKGGYIWSALKNLVNWNPSPLHVTVDGRSFTCYSLIICNGAKYGGHMKAAPNARLDEPVLYAVLMHGRRRLDVIRYAIGILTGTHLRLKDVTYLRCSDITIEGNAHIQADGDYMGVTPARITLSRDSLRLIY